MTMQVAAAERQYEALHEKRPFHDGTFTRWSKKPTDKTPFHFRDGVTIYAASYDVNPDDEFLGSGVHGGHTP